MDRLKVLFLLAILISITATALVVNSVNTRTIKTGFEYHGSVDIKQYRDGKLIFHDRSTNVITNDGKEWIEDELGDSASASTNVANNITLGNTSAPTASDTSLPGIIGECGLNGQTGTYANVATSNGNWTITYTFTSTCDNILVNTTGLYVGNTGTFFAGTSFTDAILQSNDQIQIQWNIWVT